MAILPASHMATSTISGGPAKPRCPVQLATAVSRKPASAAALQQDLGSLKAALAQANLEPGDLHCLGRDQTRVTAPQGQFVNRAS